MFQNYLKTNRGISDIVLIVKKILFEEYVIVDTRRNPTPNYSKELKFSRRNYI